MPSPISEFAMPPVSAPKLPAPATTKAEQQKDSADIFGEAKPLLTDWIMELTRDEIIKAFMALPSESQPAAGVRVNGILYESSTATQKGQWQADNSDRVLFGASTANRVASAVATDHTASLVNVDTTADKCTGANLSLLKRVAMGANPRIRPYRTKDGYEYYVAFAGLNTFRDLKIDLATVNKDARPRFKQIPWISYAPRWGWKCTSTNMTCRANWQGKSSSV
jgi:hypothetical protein